MIRNNLNGTFFMTREVATRAMIPKKRGRIVNVTAMVARGFPGMSHTGAARAGVENMTRSLAIEWAQHNLRVNAVAPGNNIKSSGTAQYGDEMLELARKATPIKRLGTPEEIARMIVFLASDQNDFITGQVFGIDGECRSGVISGPSPTRSPRRETGRAFTPARGRLASGARSSAPRAALGSRARAARLDAVRLRICAASRAVAGSRVRATS